MDHKVWILESLNICIFVKVFFHGFGQKFEVY